MMRSGMIARLVGVALVVVLVVSFGAVVSAQRQPNWTPIVQMLREQPTSEGLAELAREAIGLFAGDDAERLLAGLSPEHTILYCAGTGCLGLVLVTPPNELVAGQTEAGASRAYNQGDIVGFVGTFGGTLAPDVEGFFLLQTSPDGSIALVNAAGEQVASLVASHLLQVGATPLPIPRPEDRSTLLSEQALEMVLEIESPTATASAESRSPVAITIGRTDRDGFFSGVALCGAIPINLP